jgi:transcriptional regulator with XRE-family HTH domain
MEFAKTLKTVLRQKAKTTGELARKINVSPKTINDWLTGRTPRDLDAVKRCAEYFGVSFHFLLYGEDDRRNVIEEILEKTELHTGLYEISIRKVSPKRK